MSNSTGPQLICPSRAALSPDDLATFTYFILPFAYSLRALPGEPKGYSYRPAEPPDLAARRKYLTNETRETLFERTRWLRLDAGPVGVPAGTGGSPDARVRCWRHFKTRFADRRDLEVAIGLPWVLLFEADRFLPSECDKRRVDCEHPLQTGLLLLPVALLESQDELGIKQVPTLANLLEFNELFRYVDKPYPAHPQLGFERLVREYPMTRTDANGHVVEQALHSGGAFHDGWYSERWLELLRYPCHLSAQSGPMTMVARDPGAPTPWSVYADDRAFTWTCASVEERDLIELTRGSTRKDENGWWVKLANIDPAPGTSEDGAALTPFERDWIRDHTYRRWLDGEPPTLYGYCYHGGAQLRGENHSPVRTNRHFETMYLDQVLLLLYLRACTFRFSESLGDASAASCNGDDGGFSERMTELRRDFAIFTNLYRFPLLSNQQQGVELYELAHRAMDVKVLFDETHAQIRATDEFLTLKRQLEDAKNAERLNHLVLIATAALLGLELRHLPGLSALFGRPETTNDELVTLGNGLLHWAALGALVAGCYGLLRWLEPKLGKINGIPRK